MLLVLTDQPLVPRCPGSVRGPSPAAQLCAFHKTPINTTIVSSGHSSILTSTLLDTQMPEALQQSTALIPARLSLSCGYGIPIRDGPSADQFGEKAFGTTRPGAQSYCHSDIPAGVSFTVLPLSAGAEREAHFSVSRRPRHGRSFLSREIEVQDDTLFDNSECVHGSDDKREGGEHYFNGCPPGTRSGCSDDNGDTPGAISSTRDVEGEVPTSLNPPLNAAGTVRNVTRRPGTDEVHIQNTAYY